MCVLNNWKDELPFTEMQGGGGSSLAFGRRSGFSLAHATSELLIVHPAELLSQQLHLRVWGAGRGAVGGLVSGCPCVRAGWLQGWRLPWLLFPRKGALVSVPPSGGRDREGLGLGLVEFTMPSNRDEHGGPRDLPRPARKRGGARAQAF